MVSHTIAQVTRMSTAAALRDRVTCAIHVTWMPAASAGAPGGGVQGVHVAPQDVEAL